MEKNLQTMINNMPEKTGRSLEEWKLILKEKAFAKHGQAVKFLKEEHQVSHGFSNTIVTLSKDQSSTPEDLVAGQYKGKEALLPIYEKLLSVIDTIGEDITKTPKKGSVSIIRKKQFALIKPATKTRIDLGLKIKGKPTTDRLESSGPFGSMCTHRVRLSAVEEVDQQLLDWLTEAYQLAT